MLIHLVLCYRLRGLAYHDFVNGLESSNSRAGNVPQNQLYIGVEVSISKFSGVGSGKTPTQKIIFNPTTTT